MGMGSANERRCYIVMHPLIGWVHAQNDLCMLLSAHDINQNWVELLDELSLQTLL